MTDIVEVLRIERQTADLPGAPARLVAVTGKLRLPAGDPQSMNEAIAQAQTMLALSYGAGSWTARRSDDLRHMTFRWELEAAGDETPL